MNSFDDVEKSFDGTGTDKSDKLVGLTEVRTVRQAFESGADFERPKAEYTTISRLETDDYPR